MVPRVVYASILLTLWVPGSGSSLDGPSCMSGLACPAKEEEDSTSALQFTKSQVVKMEPETELSDACPQVEGTCSAQEEEEVDTLSALQARHFATALATEVLEESGLQEQCGDCDYASSKCQNSGRQKCQMVADCEYPWPIVQDEMSCQHAGNSKDGCTCEPLNSACRGTPGRVCWGFVAGTNCRKGSGPGCRQKPAQAGDFCWFSGSSKNFRYCPGTEPPNTTSTESTTTSTESTTTSTESTTTSTESTTTTESTEVVECEPKKKYCKQLCSATGRGWVCQYLCLFRWRSIKRTMQKYCDSCCQDPASE